MALNTVLTQPSLATSMGQAGRDRAVSEFGWRAVAEQTAALYSELVSAAG
jgi:alpha-maltose-1-phosphate synthase